MESTDAAPGPEESGAISWCAFESGRGPFRIAATGRGACRIGLPGEDAGVFFRWLALRFRRASLREDPERLGGFADGIRAYLAGAARELPGPVDLRGSGFQRRVWLEVARIPFGTAIPYREIARRIGAPKASRAVGAAVASNPLPILVPTHRVVGADGRVPGYGPAVPFKEALLRLEGIALPARRRLAPRPLGEPAAPTEAERA